MKREADDFKNAAEKQGLTHWHLRDCSMCRYPLSYIFQDGRVYFDRGCDCTYGSSLEPREWDDIAEHYNMQDNQEYIAKMDAFWFPEV